MPSSVLHTNTSAPCEGSAGSSKARNTGQARAGLLGEQNSQQCPGTAAAAPQRPGVRVHGVCACHVIAESQRSRKEPERGEPAAILQCGKEVTGQKRRASRTGYRPRRPRKSRSPQKTAPPCKMGPKRVGGDAVASTRGRPRGIAADTSVEPRSRRSDIGASPPPGTETKPQPLARPGRSSPC